MKNFEPLEKFIKLHPFTWKKALTKKPYKLMNVKVASYNKDWYILNYNLFNSDFFNPVVRCCRGTVVEVKGFLFKKVKVLCGPYLKFANYGESYADKVDFTNARYYDKVDGILIKCFKVNGKMYWVTNASFEALTFPFSTADSFSIDSGNEPETENCKSYADLLKYALLKDCPNLKIDVDVHPMNTSGDWIDKIPDGWSLMFELVSPRNRIICKYPATKLYFHGCRDANGQEHWPEDVADYYGIPYEIPKSYDCNSLEGAKKILENFVGEDQEGFVVCDNTFKRVKLKCDDYLKIKYSLGNDGLSAKALFKAIIDNDYDDILGRFPESKDLVESLKKELSDFKEMWVAAWEKYHKKYVELNSSKKDYVAWVKANIDEDLVSLVINFAEDEPNKKLENILNKIIGAHIPYKDFKNYQAKLERL